MAILSAQNVSQVRELFQELRDPVKLVVFSQSLAAADLCAQNEALVREVREETGILVRPRDVMIVFDRIERDAGGVAYHFVVIDYRCDYVSGEVRAGDDATDAAWVAEADLGRYDLPALALEVIQQAFREAG